MNLISALTTLLNWILYVGLVLSLALFVISIVLAFSGRNYTKLFYSSLAGILLASSAHLIQQALIEGISLAEPYNTIALLIISGLIVVSILYYAFGNPEMGSKAFIAAALSAAFFAGIPAIQSLFGEASVVSMGACSLTVTNQVSGGKVDLNIVIPYGRGQYNLDVFWGDGTRTTATISASQATIVSHTYSSPGTYGISILAKSVDGSGGICMNTIGVNVNPAPLPWFASLFDFSGISNTVNQFIQIPYQLFYTAPEFNLSEDSEDMRMYQVVAGIAMSFFAIFLVLRIVSGFLDRDPSESLADSIKDAVIVVVVILMVPILYQIVASLCNSVAISAVYSANIADPTGLAVLVGTIIASIFLGIASSFFGTLGGLLAVGMMFASVAAVVRFALIKAIIFCTPLLAVVALFPVMRGAVRFIFNLLIGLILAGPIAAFVLVGFSTIPGIGGIAKFTAPVFAMIAFPFVFTLATGGNPTSAAMPLTRIGAGIFSSMIPKQTSTTNPSSIGKTVSASGLSGSVSGLDSAGEKMTVISNPLSKKPGGTFVRIGEVIKNESSKQSFKGYTELETSQNRKYTIPMPLCFHSNTYWEDLTNKGLESAPIRIEDGVENDSVKQSTKGFTESETLQISSKETTPLETTSPEPRRGFLNRLKSAREKISTTTQRIVFNKFKGFGNKLEEGYYIYTGSQPPSRLIGNKKKERL